MKDSTVSRLVTKFLSGIIVMLLLVAASETASAAKSDTIVYSTRGDDSALFVKDRAGVKRISPPLAEGFVLQQFDVDSKGRTVLYTVGNDSWPPENEFFSHDLKSSVTLKVNVAKTSESLPINVSHLQFDAKGKVASYIVEEGPTRSLYILDIKSKNSLLASPSNEEFESVDIYSPKFSPSGRGIVYSLYGYDEETQSSSFAFYYCDLKSGIITKIPKEEQAIVETDAYFVNNGKQIAYLARSNSSGNKLFIYDIKSGETTNPFQVDGENVGISYVDLRGQYVVIGNGGERELLHFIAVSTGIVTTYKDVFSPVIDPKAKSAVVRISTETEDSLALIDLKSGTSSTLTSTDGTAGHGFDLKGTSLIYAARKPNSHGYDLFHYSIKKKIVSKINNGLMEGSDIQSCWVNRTGQSVYYAAFRPDENRALYKKDLKSGFNELVNEPLSETESLSRYLVVGGKEIQLRIRD